MANTFDYTKKYNITITNTVKNACACDAGSPAIKELALYEDIADKCCAKWDYVFNADGSFAMGDVVDGKVVIKEDGTKHVVSVVKKFKNTDRQIPTYRVANSKILKQDDIMKITSARYDEIVFFEKLAYAYGSRKFDFDTLTISGGDIEVKFEEVTE